MIHWTEKSPDDFLYQIAADFVAQLEDKIQTESWTQAELANKLGVSKGRVSQILNNPGNLGLRTMIRFTRVLGMKLAIVAYDDKDPENKRGPINSEVFRVCWERSGKPANFWNLQESRYTAISSGTFRLSIKTPTTLCETNISIPRTEQRGAETDGSTQHLWARGKIEIQSEASTYGFERPSIGAVH